MHWSHTLLTTISIYTHTPVLTAIFPGLPRWAGTRKVKPRDSEWQWHQLGHMQVCTLLQTNNQASTTPLSFLQAGCPSCRPTNSVEALKAISLSTLHSKLTTVSDVHQMSPCSLTLEIKVIRKTACLQNVLDSLLLLKFWIIKTLIYDQT